MALTDQAYNRAAAAEAAERNGRPHLTDARKEANATYQRRRARTAVDELLLIDPEHYDEHTRKVLIETLPKLAAAGASTLELPEPLQAAWCDYVSSIGHCTLPEGHAGDHDPDPYAGCLCPSIAEWCPPADAAPEDHYDGCPMHDNGDYRA